MFFERNELPFAKVMKQGVIVDISSNSAYQLPKLMIPQKTYRLAEKHEQAFLDKLLRMCRLVKDSYKSAGLAYALSKNFAVWYAKNRLLNWAAVASGYAH